MKLTCYGGAGFGLQNKIGEYCVKIDNDYDFKSFSEAKTMYDNYKGEKAFWNRKTMTLLDCWFIDPSNGKDSDELPFD